MESFVASGTVTSLGLSNTDVQTLQRIYELATIKPHVVQNRFTEDTIANPNPKMPANLPYPELAFDSDVREYCKNHGVIYTPWGLLWGNSSLLDNQELFEKIGREIGVSKQVACFGTMLRVGNGSMKILCGTTKEERMTETLNGLKRIDEFVNESEENSRRFSRFVEQIENLIDT